jgi:plasmid stabilization system protein ParE
MAHRVAPRAEADLDDIWLYVAKESGSSEIANRLIDTITARFFTLARFPRERPSHPEFAIPNKEPQRNAKTRSSALPAFNGAVFVV